ncbi:pseudouridine-5-phosphate glycosidase [Rhodosalinus halophilus]|uniref:Pseudouridine-5'-phosphate glycosidase n=1 Tax=Rhodosalinus halophilus TaxID=2259333 RepID=A0A365U8G5_9RHOB|nr:pseudouridine-5'-phosphate glycosidase [Rhodosalinus halophilus]RBI85030.1 pseudouridine-5-phosphate glycosidase [Rhodosalinus halophilus]
MSGPVLAPEVSEALAAGRPVVALESTIISHGLPWPDNLDLARAVEEEVRAGGAVPATIAVIDGTLRAGLDAEALERLARAEGIAKLSRADLAVCIARGGTGATTVAATMIAAARAGIAVFATGGIGGVHRGAERSFDVSADLQELAQTPVTVVASGAKAILDLPKTLEMLETLGVPVIAYGQSGFPAFWARESGLAAPLRMDAPAEIARAHLTRAGLGLPGGQLVANPIPAEAEIPLDELEGLIAQAQREAEAAGATGKAVTPALLDRLRALTQGRTLAANAALVRANARLGAAVAQEIARQRAEGAPPRAGPL